MSPIEHAPTETNGSIAAPETNDRFVVHTCTQALFFSLGTAAKLLDLPSNRLHFIGGTVGGGFGGKVDSLDRAARDPRRHADRAPRALSCSVASRRCSTAVRAGRARMSRTA